MITYRPLRQILKKRNISFKQLKNECFSGYPSMAAKFLKDRTVTTDTLNKVCEYLHVQPSEIMEWIPDSEYEKSNAEKKAIEAQIAELQAKLKTM